MWKEMKHILPSVIWALHRADMDFYWYNWAEKSILVYTGKKFHQANYFQKEFLLTITNIFNGSEVH